MDRAHWLLAAGLSAVAIAAMVVVTAESEPGSDEPPPRPKRSEATRAAEANSGALSGCTTEVVPTGEDAEGVDVDAIASDVERIRQLRFDDDPNVELVPVEELDRRVAEESRKGYSPAAAAVDERALRLLGAIPPGADLYELLTSGLEGAVAGIYLPDSGELLVVGGEEPGANERITLAHELEHALADEQLGIPYPDEGDAIGNDALLARQALVEGDATLLMEFYVFKHVGLGDLLDALGSYTEPDLAGQPYFVQRALLWPYTDGARFVCALYERGGWAAVDRAYDDPPRATDQILFPDRYGERPVDPPDPGDLPRPWEVLDRTELGAADLMFLFEAPAGDPDRALPDPRQAVSAWQGGEAVLWGDGPLTAMGISLVERTEDPVLCAGVAGWYAATRPDDPRRPPSGEERLVVEGPDQAAVLRCPPGEVRLGIAPELEVARRLAAG